MLKRLTVLMIDAPTREALSSRKLLTESLKHNCLNSESGEEGLALLKHNEIHMVMVDAELRDAAQTIAECRRLKPGLPVYVVSPRVNADTMGADGVLDSHSPHAMVDALQKHAKELGLIPPRF